MKIAIGLSGGVDSAVAAKILKDQGHDLFGLFLKLWSDPLCKVKSQNRCCDHDALEDARKMAQFLDIPFYLINAQDEFRGAVVDNFLDEYKNLKTPNPCIICNQKIKFDLMLQKARALGCDKLATGHYVRIKEKNDKYHLYGGVDDSKDQSYMLYRLNQKQLSYSHFPLGGMTKKEVRAKAVEWDIPVKEKPESQEICFFGDKDYRHFLKRYLNKSFFKMGKIVTTSGEVVGQHQGLINYTIGQRKGVSQEMTNKISNSKSKKNDNVPPQTPYDKRALYVVGFDVEKNQLIVGDDKEIYKEGMTVSDVHWISGCHPEQGAESLEVKIRYQHNSVKCKIELDDNKINVIFDKPQRAITPGQSAVFYSDDEVLGGGTIK